VIGSSQNMPAAYRYRRALSRVKHPTEILAPPMSLCLPRSFEVTGSGMPITMTIGNRP
jgi:hypothetical protein